MTVVVDEERTRHAKMMKKIYGTFSSFLLSLFLGVMSTMKLMNIHACRNQTMEAGTREDVEGVGGDEKNEISTPTLAKHFHAWKI